MTNVTRVVPLATAVKKVALTTAASGATSIVAAPTGTGFIRVLALVVITTSANSVKFQSAANDISGLFPLGANGGFTLPFNEHGWFDCNAAEALNLNQSAAVSTGLQLVYQVMGSVQ